MNGCGLSLRLKSTTSMEALTIMLIAMAACHLEVAYRAPLTAFGVA